LAHARGAALDDIMRQTTVNAQRVFGSGMAAGLLPAGHPA
jgi:poly(3-hydroxybutyrate) depolymerase